MSSYIRWQGKVRETKTVVQILDLAHEDSVLSPDSGRWATFCIDHGICVSHPTSQIAWDMSAHPLTWCTGCQPKKATKVTNVLNLPAKSYDFFVDLASDAGNWGGTPWLDGNIGAGRSASAMSQTLVRAGLITIGHDDDQAYAIFTEAGKAAAASIGIEVEG